MNRTKLNVFPAWGGIAVLLLGLTGAAHAQDGVPDECKCIDGCPAALDSAAAVEITNLQQPKPPDLVLCATDAEPGFCEWYWMDQLGMQVTSRVSTVQEAIAAIIAAYASAGNTPINVVVDGHGRSGLQCFGPDVAAYADQCIGNDQDDSVNQPWGPTVQANKDKFVLAVKGKIKNLVLLGCSAAADPKGQGFLKKLTADLEANMVKGWEGTNWTKNKFVGPVTATVCGVFPACSDALCPKGEVCVEEDTVPPEGDDACRCRPMVAGIYASEGDKKEIPTVSEWGLVVMTLLVLTAGTMVVLRRRPATA